MFSSHWGKAYDFMISFCNTNVFFLYFLSTLSFMLIVAHVISVVFELYSSYAGKFYENHNNR